MNQPLMGQRALRMCCALLTVLLLGTFSIHSDAAAASAATPKSSQLSKQAELAARFAKIQADRAAKVVELVNKERTSAGLKKLVVHDKLRGLAKDKAIDLYKHNYFSHTSPTFGSPFDMMDAYHITFRYAGENIAKGQRTPEEVVKDWMKSPGHRKNILNAHYTLIGVGYYNGLWVQEFIGK
ncbi:CAP domain-containing protein [Paenibacillus sp. YPG26]|uniref:CAP domain-containing protein n=1 Tax=Paenibacillus sp. YPG26 TaxID=2878915 RepID=UPI00203DED51|nr:CAP domain-containing protein [Paenibacillus sp. YPG26]USB34843.1 CAP domain-containing protein [Paenibacillus sp. YPG26]